MNNWQKIPKALTQISVGSRDHVWGIDQNNEIWQWSSGGWIQIDGRLKYVSVGADGTVWGVNAHDNIFRRDGDGWTRIAGKLKQISVGDQYHIWGVNANDDIWQWTGSGWTHLGGKLKRVSVGVDGAVWGVNASDNIYRRDGNRWTHIAGKLKQISVGNKNHVWGVNAGDNIYRRDGNSWTQITGKLKHVSIGADGTLWGVNATDQIWAWIGWQQIHGKLKQISVSNKNHVWGVNASGNIYRRDGDSWTNITGKLKHVSVGTDGTVWGVNASGNIYRRDGDGWTQIAGKLKQISVGDKNHVWGVNASDNIYRRDGDTWTQIGGKLKHVSVGSDGAVWGVNASDNIYRRDGNGWTHIRGRLKQISVGNNHTIWGVNANDEIWRWTGSGWARISGGLKYVSIDAAGTIWGVNASDDIWTWFRGAAGLLENGGTIKQAVAAQASKTVVVSAISRFDSGGSLPPITANKPQQTVVAENVTRNQLSVPVCPANTVTDEVIFEAATDATQQQYLPRYRPAEETVSGQQQYQIWLTPNGSGWRLTVFVEAYPAPNIEQASRDATALEHTVRLFLAYHWRGQEVRSKFQEVTKEAGGQRLKASLYLSNLEARDTVYQILTDATYGAVLLIQREINVAIPLEASSRNQTDAMTMTLYPEADASASERNAGKSHGQTQFLDVAPTRGIASSRGQRHAYLRFDLSAMPKGIGIQKADFQMTSSTGFAFGGDGNQYVHLVADDSWGENAINWHNKPALGSRLGHWWTWYGYPMGGDMDNRTFSIDVTSQVTTALAGDRRISLGITSPGYWVRYFSRHQSEGAHRPQLTVTYNQLYKKVNVVLEDFVDETFFFPVQLHSYIYRDIEPAQNHGGGFIRKRIQWQGRWHNYYQDEQNRYQFYYLPDRFEIGRNPDTQSPAMTLRFESPDGSSDPDKMVATLQYYASPFVESERLNAASSALLAQERITLPTGVTGLEFIPLQGEEVTLQLDIPRSTSPGRAAQPRVNLQDGIFDTLSLSLADFQKVWDALFSKKIENRLFTGQVNVKLTGGSYSETIQFDARLDTNPDDLFSAILEPGLAATYSKTLHARTFPDLFVAPPDRPQDQIQVMLLDFGMETAELTPKKLDVSVTISRLIQEIVLRQADRGVYPYKLTVIRKSGRTTDDRQTESEIVYPDVTV
ncbi:MAG: tectonin domain-containing protein [Chloroflexota bacterium]